MSLATLELATRLELLGHAYISDEFIRTDFSTHRYVTYTCRCGSLAISKVATVSQGFGCKACKSSNISNTLTKYSYDFVATELAKYSQTVIDFTKAGSPMTYICRCGNVATVKHACINWLYRYEFCKACRKPKNYLGINHTLSQLAVRQTALYRNWRQACLERDLFSCQNCENDSRLHVHHILAFAKYQDKRFEIANGITFCETCHITFHSLFGQAATEEQLKLF